MREIKFRAWDGKEMDESFTLEGLTYIYDCGYYCESYGFKFDIFQEGVIVMQYTGLKDRNGKEIYEGDIVKEEFNHGWCNCQVVYKNAGFFICNEREEIEDNLHWHVNGLEVIGNIYENPNLLSQDK